MSQRNTFNEATRVQMPAMVHLTRLGFNYFGKISEENAGQIYDPDTNILLDVFKEQFEKLNPENGGDAEHVLREICQELDNDDLGRSFYNRLTSVSPTRLIDFDNPKNNIFHFTAEFTCKRDQDEFRPDISLFVNGLPLVFIEVKKPNNQGGMVAESNRMNRQRFPNKKFRRFVNITQLMIFSNNMEYDTMGGIVPIQGAFYCTAARESAPFNSFREENPADQEIAPYIQNYCYNAINVDDERRILSDYNCQVIHTAPEYQTNLNFNTPTNRIITSMCSPERLLFIVKYGIAYVKMEREVDGAIETTDQKHIMRYQQMFASMAICSKLDEGVKSGVIWHTQGSGKTALSFYLNHVLSDYFAAQNKVAKFYFIVDRLDLLEQASQEFEARGLEVKTADSRAELMEQFKTNQALEGSSGKSEITVVNIQRFAEDKEKIEIPPYATNLQRIFIIDEAHRGYNPTGSFLANLFDSDKNSIKIALTGTPLLKEERASWKVFGDYIHTYYYDKSIQDGYTLKIIREDIETSYRESLSTIYEKLEKLVEKKDIKKKHIIEHESYVKELVRFIIKDLKSFRLIHGDNTLGGMVICESSEQARNLYAFFDDVQYEINSQSSEKSNFKVGLILHDSEDKETRKKIVKDFKKNMTVDILIVFNMLLTGFDAPRLKRVYFGRKLKDHNLLQALTRVNRPYKDNRYGYIIDFADIKKNFVETNEAYLKELNRFNDTDETGEGNATDTFQQVLEDKDALIAQMREVRQTLFNYTTDNLEDFSSEISTIEDKKELLQLKKVLVSARDCCNIVRTFGDEDLKEAFSHLEITKLPTMISEVQHHINNINQKEAFYQNDSTKMLVNEAMKDITFNFSKIDEEEMKIILGGMELQKKWKRAINDFTENMDPDDPEFITLREAFILRFKEHGFVIDSVNEFKEHSKALDEVLKKLQELKKRNNILLKKYKGDVKFARVHKRIREENVKRKIEHKKPMVSEYDESVINTLLYIKNDIDQQVYDRNDILKKDAYFEQTVMKQIKEGMNKLNLDNSREDRLFIQVRITKQYLNQYSGTYPAV
ncbi:type I restriction endonuclease subunit R [Psychrobacillus lasiicapitis]|uniref:Type I restriction enzyme endonuclease subunit n=1 Tax=Psychrobacillus lasiicapitis TaxID=1636719 RepID=A0A544T1X6_9BACI|nr:HsdR family type I site-specific deoxyribonuclease [Psychrobacillus lasiicapitis]TQR11410.1 type I restriction endonuclease subunit R [Psychrobacillus lasiicapitis]GGA40777.1 type I restriction-modification system endonuclease [Psychrobacillus lasiicapitis]